MVDWSVRNLKVPDLGNGKFPTHSVQLRTGPQISSNRSDSEVTRHDRSLDRSPEAPDVKKGHEWGPHLTQMLRITSYNRLLDRSPEKKKGRAPVAFNPCTTRPSHLNFPPQDAFHTAPLHTEDGPRR